jgi:ribosome-binding protein aMBF1 (putative translation factor)
MTATKIILNNRSFVIVPESDWAKVSPVRKGRAKTNGHGGKRDTLPPLPRADERGNRPALAFADAAIARGIIQRRKRLGLSQLGLANLAGIRVEVLNRAERAVTIPSVRTLIKIENVLQRLESRAKNKQL